MSDTRQAVANQRRPADVNHGPVVAAIAHGRVAHLADVEPPVLPEGVGYVGVGEVGGALVHRPDARNAGPSRQQDYSLDHEQAQASERAG